MTITEDMLQVREIAKERFNFLVIDSPEKWEAASEFKRTFRLTLPGADKVLEIPMIGLSYDQFNEVLSKHPIPEWDGEGEPNEVFKVNQKTIGIRRRIDLLEMALGKKIQGESYDEKRVMLEKTNPGNIEEMYAFITGELSNTALHRGIYLAGYLDIKARFPQETVEQIGSFEDFFAATNDVTHFLRMNRGGQDYIVEFPLKTLTQETKEEIEKRCVEPQPPLIPSFHPITRKPIPGKPKQNYEDPQYIRAYNKYMKLRTIMYLNACLPFRIPGETEDEQSKWIGSRLVGDVRQVNDFINDVILGIEGRYNFFMNV